MEAFFDSHGLPKVKLTVIGKRQTGNLEALIDTGFNGFISLPIATAVSLGLELVGTQKVEFADGRTSQELVFLVDVSLDGSVKTVTTTLTGGSATLVGTSLFTDYQIKFDFPSHKIQFTK